LNKDTDKQEDRDKERKTSFWPTNEQIVKQEPVQIGAGVLAVNFHQGALHYEGPGGGNQRSVVADLEKRK